MKFDTVGEERSRHGVHSLKSEDHTTIILWKKNILTNRAMFLTVEDCAMIEQKLKVNLKEQNWI